MLAHKSNEGDERNDNRYSGAVYKAAWELTKVYVAADADMDEYNAERERLRQVGLTIDPATAEITSWHANIADPYCILDDVYCSKGSLVIDRFARNPGGEWVYFGDLPEATLKALNERDLAHDKAYDAIRRQRICEALDNAQAKEKDPAYRAARAEETDF